MPKPARNKPPEGGRQEGKRENEAELNILVLYWHCDSGCEFYRVGECDFGDFSKDTLNFIKYKKKGENDGE